MKLKINLTKSRFYMIISGLFIFNLLILATSVDINQGWHPLSKISKSSSDMTSVDNNLNGIIDLATRSAECDGAERFIYVNHEN